MKQALLMISLLLISTLVSAHNHSSADMVKMSMAETVVIEGAWARETFSMAKSGAAYLTLKNSSEHPVSLASASVDAGLASTVELHTTNMQDGIMRMMEIEESITVGAGESVMLQPGGMHIMLMGLEKPLLAGESFSLTLSFDDDSFLTTVVPVKDMSNKSADAKEKHKHH